MRTLLGLIAATLCLGHGCGCADRSLPGVDADAATDGGGRDGGQPGDGPRGDGGAPGCAAQDALPTGAKCGLLLGYAWDGGDCRDIQCECMGADCDALYESYGACMSAFSRCLPPTWCESLDWSECEASESCRVLLYGGGCVDTTTCSGNCAGGAGCVCWERGLACVPAAPPCGARARLECTGDCFWVAQTSEVCFDACCFEERWGYCRGRPPAASCARQEITGCPEPCTNVAGVWWSGDSCQPIVCCCEGPDCGATYDTWQECLDAHRACPLDSCAATGGYCDYGDFVIPTCLEGYGKDYDVVPGTCGLGVCCAPCPDPTDDRVHYVSNDPGVCARSDFGCEPGWVGFDNECGCGCRLP